MAPPEGVSLLAWRTAAESARRKELRAVVKALAHPRAAELLRASYR